jgi:hypothetical protein
VVAVAMAMVLLAAGVSQWGVGTSGTSSVGDQEQWKPGSRHEGPATEEAIS